MADLVVEVLTDEGLEAHCHDGPEALDAIREKQPDLILLDWLMYPVSGEDILTALRADVQLSSIPVILISAFHDAENVAAEWSFPVLKKPFDVHRLLGVVGRFKNGGGGSLEGSSAERVPGLSG